MLVTLKGQHGFPKRHYFSTFPGMDCIILWKRPFTINFINNLWINDCKYMKIMYVNCR